MVDAGQRPRRPVDGHLTDRPMGPQMLHHGHGADLRQGHRLAAHPHSVRAVVSVEPQDSLVRLGDYSHNLRVGTAYKPPPKLTVISPS